MGTSNPEPSQRAALAFNLILRFRRVFIILAAAVLLFAFNGHWRIGRDSAEYRLLGHRLATTGHYSYRTSDVTLINPDNTRYPGLPILLAGLELVFGQSDLAPTAFIVVLAAASLWLSFVLARRFSGTAAWLPVAVVFGVATNCEFLLHAHEILSDVPFLFCMLATLCLYPLALAWTSWKKAIVPIGLLCITLIVGSSLRPTFWIFAVAMVVTLIIDAIAPRAHVATQIAPKDPQSDPENVEPPPPAPSRRRALIVLGILLLASVAFVMLDIRNKKHSALGGYELRVLRQLPVYFEAPKLFANAYEAFERALPEFFFGTQFGNGFIRLGGYKWGLGTIISLILVLSPLVLWRRGRLYTIFPILTVFALAALGAVPRYFLMVLPLLLISWGLVLAAVARRIRRPAVVNIVVFVGLGMVVVPNVMRCVLVCLEQRGVAAPWKRGQGWRGIHYVGFRNAYSDGQWRDVHPVAGLVRANTRPRDRIIGPEASVLSYLSDRNVVDLGRLVPLRDSNNNWVQHVRDARIAYAIFPVARSEFPLYREKEIAPQLMADRRLRPQKILATAAGYVLATFEFSAPPRRTTPPRKGTGTKRLQGVATQPTTQAKPRPTTLPTTTPTSRSGRRIRATQPASIVPPGR